MSTTEHETMTEREFLEAQVADAEAAWHETWNDLKGTLKETASLELWVRRHPWMAAGAAVAGGFVLASMLFSPAEEAEASHEAEEDDDRPRASASRPRRLAWLIGPLFGLLRPFAGEMISSFLSAAMAQASAPPSSEAATADPARPPAGEGPVPL